VNLDKFGFTPTETRAYAALLKLGTVTGYALARDLGIARANVYQALEGLVRRGAARRSATMPAQYAAISPSTLVAELQRTFRRDLAELEVELRSLPQRGNGSGVAAGLEALGGGGSGQLLERAAACADAAREEIFAITGPWAAALNDALERAVRRAVRVEAVALMAPSAGVAALRPASEEELRREWGGFPVAVSADRARCVLGALDAAGGRSGEGRGGGSGEGGGGGAIGLVTEFAAVVPLVRRLLAREVGGT
jgi:sugar-specific transcriptional regulator TrmB